MPQQWNGKDLTLPETVEELIDLLDELFRPLATAPQPGEHADAYGVRYAYASGQRSVVEVLIRMRNDQKEEFEEAIRKQREINNGRIQSTGSSGST